MTGEISLDSRNWKGASVFESSVSYKVEKFQRLIDSKPEQLWNGFMVILRNFDVHQLYLYNFRNPK